MVVAIGSVAHRMSVISRVIPGTGATNKVWVPSLPSSFRGWWITYTRALLAFNIGWHEVSKRSIYSFIEPRGFLTKPGFPNHPGSHAPLYPGFPRVVRPAITPPSTS
jgi:hypothetical protein